jgi:hypothetical protein
MKRFIGSEMGSGLIIDTPDDWILPKDSKSIWALSGVVSAKRSPTPIRRTGLPVQAKAWPQRDRKLIHKLFLLA